MKKNGLYYIKNTFWHFVTDMFETFEFVSYTPTGKYRIDEVGNMQIEFTAECVRKRLLFNDIYFERTQWIPECDVVFMPQWKEYQCNAD